MRISINRIGTHHRLAVAAVTLLVVTACADATNQITNVPVEPRPELVVGGGIVALDLERAVLGRMARSLAIALNDPELRQELKKHLRDAPFAEHKVELATYLRGATANKILGRMAANGRQTSAAVLANLLLLRSVELYMPLPQHRENWIGDEEVLVAAQLVEHDPVMAFNARGDAVPMDENNLPAQPTLAIVGTETRFDKPMSPSTSRNVNDRDGKAIGTLVPVSAPPAGGLKTALVPCNPETGTGECGGGGAGGGTSLTPGLYLEFSRILDAKEPLIRGTPEVEVHIHGASDDNTPLTGVDMSCSGEWAPDTRKRFDQNGGFWEGRVLLFTNEEIAQYPPDRDFQIIYWEDDNEPCILKLDNKTVFEYMFYSVKAAGSAALKFKKGYHWSLYASVFVFNILASAGDWMLTNDDYIGVAVIPHPMGYYQTPYNTHQILDGYTLNGRADINFR